jgi:hypothetical protein
MKKLGLMVLVIFLLVLVFGCSSESTSETTAKSDDKMVIITGVNATNVAWVFERSAYGSLEYRGETDAIYAKDFTVNPGDTFMKVNSPATSYKDSDSFTETSKTTYEIKIQLIAGGPTPTDKDEQYVYDPYVAVVDFVIKGTYGKPVTIEWDGTAFK